MRRLASQFLILFVVATLVMPAAAQDDALEKERQEEAERKERMRAGFQDIVDDLKGERSSRLQRLRQQIESEDRPQYWELTDRGSNFTSLPPERRQYLEPLYAALLS